MEVEEFLCSFSSIAAIATHSKGQSRIRESRSIKGSSSLNISFNFKDTRKI